MSRRPRRVMMIDIRSRDVMIFGSVKEAAGYLRTPETTIYNSINLGGVVCEHYCFDYKMEDETDRRMDSLPLDTQVVMLRQEVDFLKRKVEKLEKDIKVLLEIAS